MTTNDTNRIKRTLTGIRNLGLEASTRSKMMRIARDYTMGKKRKKLIVFMIALIGVTGLSYGVYQGLSGSSSTASRGQQTRSIATANTDFKVPAWLGGEGKPKNVSLGKSVASGNYKAVSKNNTKKKFAKGKAKKGKAYAKKHKGKKSKYAKKSKGKKSKYAKVKKSKSKKHLASKKKSKKNKKRGSHMARR